MCPIKLSSVLYQDPTGLREVVYGFRCYCERDVIVRVLSLLAHRNASTLVCLPYVQSFVSIFLLSIPVVFSRSL